MTTYSNISTDYKDFELLSMKQICSNNEPHVRITVVLTGPGLIPLYHD